MNFLAMLRRTSSLPKHQLPVFGLLLLATGGLALPSLFAAETAKDSSAPAQTPIVINAGAEWIPLIPELEIEAGSALDFSQMGFTDAPAGKHGRVIARSDGQFAFADSPGEAQ